jgi:isocitrate lyase
MSKYEMRKERARQVAIDWQNDFENHDYSWSEIADATAYFTKLARRFGLTREFIENGIPCIEFGT